MSPEATVHVTTSALTVHDQMYAGLTGQAVYQDEKLTLNGIVNLMDHSLT